MENEYTSWPQKRNTGLKVSWHYTPSPGESVQPASKHLENNKYYIQIANIIHENHGIPEPMETFLKDMYLIFCAIFDLTNYPFLIFPHCNNCLINWMSFMIAH